MSMEVQNVLREVQQNTSTDSPSQNSVQAEAVSNNLTIDENQVNDIDVTDETDNDKSTEVVDVNSELTYNNINPHNAVTPLTVQRLAQLLANQRQQQIKIEQQDQSTLIDQSSIPNNSFSDIFNNGLIKSPDTFRNLSSPNEPRNRKASNPFSKSQTQVLRQFYSDVTVYPTQAQRQKLAEDLNLSQKQVSVWFKNRRQREKERTGVSVQEQHQYIRGGNPQARSIGELINPQQLQHIPDIEHPASFVQYLGQLQNNGVDKTQTSTPILQPQIPSTVNNQLVENIQASLGFKEVKVNCKKCSCVFTLNFTVDSKSNLYYCSNCIQTADLENPDDEVFTTSEYTPLPESEELTHLKDEVKLRDTIVQNHAEYSQSLERLCERQRNTITRLSLELVSVKRILSAQNQKLLTMNTQRQNLEDVIENCSTAIKKMKQYSVQN